MRCRNCHTVMMDTDTVCVSCHATVESATSGPPELTGGAPNGLWLLFPLFGGALGGLVYAGILASQSNGSRGSGSAAGAAKTFKKILGVLFLLGGALFLVVAFVNFDATRAVAQRVPTPATSTELRTRAYVEKPPAWVSYTFEESKPLDDIVTRRRKGHGADVQANCILVRVDQRWLVATVAKGFEGNELIGQLMPIDSPVSQPLIERVRKEQADPKTILPYEFFAVEGCASDQQFRYTVVAWTGGIGLVVFLLGLWLVFGGRR